VVKRLIPFAFLAVALAAPRAHAVAKTWNGSVNIQWNVSNNWTPAGVPTATDDVTINVAGTVRISNNAVAADAVAASLTIGAAVILDRRNGHILTVTNGITVNSPSDVSIQVPFTAASLSKSGAGNLTLNGTALNVTTPQVASVNVTGGTHTMNGGNPLTTSGAVSVSGGATLARNGAGFLNVGGAVSVDGGTMTFAAGGGLTSAQVTVMGGGTVSFAGAGGLASSGAVSVTNGTMSFAGGGDLTAAGSTVTVGAGGTLSFPGNASLGAGEVTVNGGTVSFGGNGDLTATGAVTVTGGGSLSFGGNGDVSAQSFSLASGSSFTLGSPMRKPDQHHPLRWERNPAGPSTSPGP
jgi:hypothetical protein